MEIAILKYIILLHGYILYVMIFLKKRIHLNK